MTLLPIYQDRWITTPGGHMFTRTWEPSLVASDIPIILLHDSLGCVELWRSFPEALCTATQRRVIAYDRLGFGRSDTRNDTLSLTFIDDEPSQDFAALHQTFGPERFIVMGHSVGGCMAVQCAGAYAEYCDGLITLSAQAFNEARTRSGIKEAKAAFQSPEQLAKLEKYHGDKARWVLNAWIETWLDPGFENWSLIPALERVTCPSLVIHGEKDEYGSHRQPEQIVRYLQGPAHCEILTNIHHVPHRECEADVVGLVSQFVESVSLQHSREISS